MKRYKIASKKRFYTFVSSIVFIISFAVLMCSTNNVQSENLTKYDTIIVDHGDTLWDLAAQYNTDSSKDMRQYVYEIKKENNIFGDRISPNQVIKLPRTF